MVEMSGSFLNIDVTVQSRRIHVEISGCELKHAQALLSTIEGPSSLSCFEQTGDTEGRSMGVAVARSMIEMHHGSIDVLPDSRLGAKIVVRLPIMVPDRG